MKRSIVSTVGLSYFPSFSHSAIHLSWSSSKYRLQSSSLCHPLPCKRSKSFATKQIDLSPPIVCHSQSR